LAKKHLEPFNPWPGFVDLFASVIMVVLIFMLVLIVNITYYAQFKYKVAYIGSTAVQKLINKPIEVPKDQKEKIDKSISTIDELIKKDYNTTKDAKPLGGLDLTITDSNLTRQKNLLYEDWMVIKYLNNEVILDPQSIKDIDNFIVKSKNKYKNHFVTIFISEPKNQISASVSKQIALSRALNIRNVIRQKDYNRDDVLIRLKEKIPGAQKINHKAGYGIIIINQKK